jgi:hypothetical protein
MFVIFLHGIQFSMRIDGVKNNERDRPRDKQPDQVPGRTLEHPLTPRICFVTKKFHLVVFLEKPSKYDIARARLPPARPRNWYSRHTKKGSQYHFSAPDDFASAPGKNS